MALLLGIAALLAGCASRPPSSPGRGIFPPGQDGPEANPPSDLDKVPDAEPRVEPILPGGPNKPYDVLGHNYVPITQDQPFTERGLASWYGRKFQGKRTSSGELYNMYAMTAAHPTLPIPSYARVRNPANGRAIVVRINDRGPFHSGRIIDLSYTAALKLDVLRGVTPVELTRITFDDIRSGAWRRGSEPDDVRLATASPSPPMPPPIPSPAPAPAVPPSESPPASATMADVVPAPPAADAQAARAFTGEARGFWVQLGAFRERSGAEGFQQRVASNLDWLTPLLAVFSESSLYRLQAGPYPSREEARGVAERIRVALQLVPVIVERR